jgi:hypothetical protein
LTTRRKLVSSISRTIKHRKILKSTQQKLNIQILCLLIFNFSKDVFSFVFRSQTHSSREINWSIWMRSIAISMNFFVISTIIELIETNSNFYKSNVAHECILSMLKSFLIVDIVNEFFEWKKCTTWSKRKKMRFNDVMQKKWTCVTKNVKIQERHINDNVIASSHSNETKKINSLIYFIACFQIMISFAFLKNQRLTKKTRRKFCIDIVKKI